MRPRDLMIAGLVALLVGGTLGFVGFERLGGLSIDALFWLRHRLDPRVADPQACDIGEGVVRSVRHAFILGRARPVGGPTRRRGV